MQPPGSLFIKTS